jgi:hypothetical protein
MPAPPSLRRNLLVALFVIPLALFVAWFWYARRPIHRLPGPSLVFWAWERSEDLRFLNAKSEGVAFLVATVELLPDATHVHSRMQPLYLAPSTQLVATVRIYSHANKPASLDDAQFTTALDVLLSATHEPKVSALQIDFDARTSERDFYARLLRELRIRLGPIYPISITALASWCIGDRWIRDLPVQEAVPMLFSMGHDEALIRQYLSSVGTFSEPLCRGSLGLSTGEPWPGLVGSRTRVYVFSQTPWTREAVDEVRKRLHR